MKRILVIVVYAAVSMSHLFASVTITMQKRGGVFYIPGKVNGLTLNFVFDTGASNVYISLAEAIFMLKNGYLSYSDFDYATVYNNIAWFLCLSDKNLEALSYAEQSVKLDAAHDYSWETLGEIYYNLARYNDCIKAMTRCIDLSGKHKSAYEFRAKCYQRLGRFEEANRDIEIAKTL